MLKSNLFASGMALLLVSACVSTKPVTDAQLNAEVAELRNRSSEEATKSAERRPVSVSQGYSLALREAIMQSPRYQQAIATYEEFQAGIRVAQSGGKVQGSLSATAGAIDEGSGGSTTGVAGDVSLSQLLFDGGVTKASVNSASARAYGALYGARQAGNEVAMEAARAWGDLWQYSQRINILETRLRELEPLIAQIESLRTSGIVDRSAVAEAEKQIINVRLEQETLNARRTEAQERFNRFFSTRPSSVGKPVRLFTTAELQALQGAVSDAPELQVAAANVIATAYDAEAARGRLKPTVAVRTGVNSPLDQDDDPDATVGLVLQFQFSDGGRRRAEAEALENRLLAAREGLEDARRAADAEFATALASNMSLWKSWELVNQQTKTLETQLETIRSQIGSGQSSIGNLVETEIEYYRAMSRMVEIEAEIAVVEIGIAGRVGVLLPKLKVDPREGTKSE